MNSTTASRWDIFCLVVDNFGDIGVTWRLAKQLHREYGIHVTLWVDCLASFAHILPALDCKLSSQHFDGVTIKLWDTPLSQEYQAGDVLIEAFACELPDAVKNELSRLNAANKPVPVWLNLEYLCAEAWVDGCHGLPSMQANGLTKHFFFPGFSEKSGGLICEQDLFAERDAWQVDQNNKLNLFSQLGLTGIDANDTVISVFSYETPALAALCEMWQQGSHKTHALIPKGRSLNSLTTLLNCDAQDIMPGQQFSLGNLTIHILPMTDQQGYDRLLWSADFNIVRGEDSFLRAQWAAKPFIWHIYPQEDDYHLVKLRAFLEIYCDNLAPELANHWSELNIAFNTGESNSVLRHWKKLNSVDLSLSQDGQHHLKQWPIDALNDADLATRLINFVNSKSSRAKIEKPKIGI
ncbi:elongation factor P maturation arginine rhamnosyltransferase EarP [Shewanella sp. SR44-3]|uniref:elongation factor P maturation arginine rhamnosyltransferase EarP n=1 Tax=Shewanella sp. SR44-3 TaxID=2760936 RepID=UPI0015F9BE03|nr:elongation factor P maturation arginine rhamnosyltransferase EarP [Shewanella sp. SR44-3]MBB1270521.1 elongation factor P maturation arginine rhamnosyltransferase EarP [Shewanella sp. SR44-3]